MIRGHYLNSRERWAIRKEGRYLAGERLTDNGILPAFSEDAGRAKIFHDQDLAEMSIIKYGGELVNMAVAVQAG